MVVTKGLTVVSLREEVGMGGRGVEGRFCTLF